MKNSKKNAFILPYIDIVNIMENNVLVTSSGTFGKLLGDDDEGVIWPVPKNN